MSRYTGQDIIALAQQVGATPELARIMAAAALSEGGGDTNAVGDNGNSHGPYQINLTVHNLTVAQCCDLDYATRWMLYQEFAPAFIEGKRRGYAGETLARWCCMRAERPWGWNGPNDPGLDSPAADNYAAHWRDLEAPMSTTRTYDPNGPAVRQTDSFSCSIATAAFMLESIGVDVSYPALETLMLRAGLVTGDDGLLVGSAGPLADWMAARYGLTTGHLMPVSWDWLQEHAGTMPIGIGAGRPFYHWVAVRGVDGEGNLLLSNPAPAWFAVGDTMTEAEFRTYSPFACWYIEVEEAEDMARIEELERQVADAVNLIGLMQGDWANAVESAINDAKAEADDGQRNADLDAALAALETIRRGG